MNFKVPDDETFYIREFVPIYTTEVIHHMVMNTCELSGKITTPYDCGDTGEQIMCHEAETETNYRMLMNQVAYGSGTFTLPNDVSFKVGKGTPYNYIVLQIHYNEDIEYFLDDPTIFDYSGMKVKYQITPTKFVAGSLALNNNIQGYLIPPDSTTRMGKSHVDFMCPRELFDERARGQTWALFAYLTHAHDYGSWISAYILRNDTQNQKSESSNQKFKTDTADSRGYKYLFWDLYASRSPQQEQKFILMDEQKIVGPTDTLSHRCVYHNPTNESVVMGVDAQEEMCMMYVLFYLIPPTDPHTTMLSPFCDNQELGSIYNWEDYPEYVGTVPEHVEWYSLYSR